MSRWMICICSICLFVSATALADEQPDQATIDGAYARLKAKQAAATQPSTAPSPHAVADSQGHGPAQGASQDVTLLASGMDDVQTVRKKIANSKNAELQNAVRQSTLPLTGLYLAHLVEGGPADQAGLRENDVVISIAGMPTPDMNSYRKAMKSLHPVAGQKYKIVYRPVDPNQMIWLPVKTVTVTAAAKADFAAFGLPTNGSEIITKYDRFSDETTVTTPDLEGEITSSGPLPLLQKDEAHVGFTVSALYEGKVVVGKAAQYRVYIYQVSINHLYATAFQGDKLRLLVDGAHMDLPIADNSGDGGDVPIDTDQIKALASARSVEGQVGIIEFKLSPEQITEIADFYKIANASNPVKPPDIAGRAVPAAGGAAQGNGVAKAIPNIAGKWQEAPGIILTITQNGGTWEAHCTYTKPGVGEIKWEMMGTISSDGAVAGILQHTEAPKDWAKSQTRQGQLTADGKVISGTTKWDGGGDKFTWTRSN